MTIIVIDYNESDAFNWVQILLIKEAQRVFELKTGKIIKVDLEELYKQASINNQIIVMTGLGLAPPFELAVGNGQGSSVLFRSSTFFKKRDGAATLGEYIKNC